MKELVFMNDFSAGTKKMFCWNCQWSKQAQNFFDQHVWEIKGSPTMECIIVNGEHVEINASAKLKKPIIIKDGAVQVELFAFRNVKLACPVLTAGSEPDHDHLLQI